MEKWIHPSIKTLEVTPSPGALSSETQQQVPCPDLLVWDHFTEHFCTAGSFVGFLCFELLLHTFFWVFPCTVATRFFFALIRVVFAAVRCPMT